jgi:hypothetical protein
MKFEGLFGLSKELWMAIISIVLITIVFMYFKINIFTAFIGAVMSTIIVYAISKFLGLLK